MLAHNPTQAAQDSVLECQHTIPLSTLMMLDGMLAHEQDPTLRAHSH